MVNRRSFELDYEIDSVGGSGIAKVELWGTRDGGAHWQRFGRDDDNRSPILVTVDAEGLYGFRVVVESGSGMSSETPRDGDLPEVWIDVDLTKPAARLIAADVSQEQGEVTIRWEASDPALESRPISLLVQPAVGRPLDANCLGLGEQRQLRLAARRPRAAADLSEAGSPRRGGQRRHGRDAIAGVDRSPAASRPHPRRAPLDRRLPRWHVTALALQWGLSGLLWGLSQSRASRRGTVPLSPGACRLSPQAAGPEEGKQPPSGRAGARHVKRSLGASPPCRPPRPWGLSQDLRSIAQQIGTVPFPAALSTTRPRPATSERGQAPRGGVTRLAMPSDRVEPVPMVGRAATRRHMPAEITSPGAPRPARLATAASSVLGSTGLLRCI